jgi:hypothetical protein
VRNNLHDENMTDDEAGFQRNNALSRNNIALVDYGSISITSENLTLKTATRNSVRNMCVHFCIEN